MVCDSVAYKGFVHVFKMTLPSEEPDSDARQLGYRMVIFGVDTGVAFRPTDWSIGAGGGYGSGSLEFWVSLGLGGFDSHGHCGACGWVEVGF